MEKDVQFKWDNSKNRSNVSTTDIDLKIDDVHKDQFKSSLIREHCAMPQLVVSSSSTTAVINPLKNTSYDTSSSNIIIPHHSNEPQKTYSRRNTIQPLQKKPISYAPTTSIKPLLLPAPTSDSFTQHTKSNLVSMHNSHQSSSISTPFNCQQPMTMGIATIQPQHFGYQNISNNRYPVIPMSIQNNYPTQQLTLTSGGLGTTVQLMPVMNQNNNQMNNSRMQSVPLFMTPIIGSHAGMFIQPNFMQQNSNPMQTFNIANTTYSHDFNHCQSVLSHTINSSTPRHNIVMPTEIESYPKSESEILNTTVNSTTTIVTVKENSLSNSNISTSVTVNDQSLPARSNVKERGLIRTQIYRMKQLADEENNKESRDNSPAPVDSSSTHEDHEDTSSVNFDDNKNQENGGPEIEKPENNISTLPVEPKLSIICPPSPTVDHSPVTCAINNPCNQNEKLIEPKPSPVQLSNKRKLPSPEILDSPQPIKIARMSQDDEQPVTGRKSPGSLFEKISQVIPERKTEILQNNKANKLTAVVRPEQRKMLVHYLDDLVIFESDEPFPTTNKMQVVKSALRAGNIKLTPQKSKLLNDQYLFLSADEDLSPSKLKLKPTNRLSPTQKSTSCLEPLTIDIPTTTSSSCDSLDSSQVRPLSMCSYLSTLPTTVLSKKTSMDNISPEKDMPKIEKELSSSSIKSGLLRDKEITKPLISESNNDAHNSKTIEITVTKVKEQPPVKIISPVKQQDKSEKSGLDRPICDWTVSDVVDFVKQTPGCENYTAMFQNHEIDGEALLLLSKDNLIQGALNMKIGPALKLCARIDKRKALDPQ